MAKYTAVGGSGSAVRAFHTEGLDLVITCHHAEDPTPIIKQALRRGYTFVWLSEIVAAIEGRGTLPAKPIALVYDDGRAELFTVAHPVVQAYGIKANAMLTTDHLYGLTVDATLTGYPRMTWDQARTMHGTGLWEWGNHTQKHAQLVVQSSADRIASLTAANDAIVAELGVPAPVTLAYPTGAFNAAVMKDARDLGFKLAFDNDKALRSTSKLGEHPLALNRPVMASLFDYSVDDIIWHWGYSIVGELGHLNGLGQWITTAATGASFGDGDGAQVALNCTTTRPQTLETADFFRVRAGDVISWDMATMSQSQTAGTGSIVLAQYDKDKVALAPIILSEFTAAAGWTSHFTKEAVLDAACRYVKIRLAGDAAYNGILRINQMVIRRQDR